MRLSITGEIPLTKRSIKYPIYEIWAAWSALSQAADAHIAGDHEAAERLFRKSDCKSVWGWLNPAWVDVDKNVIDWKPENDTKWVNKTERDPFRTIPSHVKKDVLNRDGYQCRYCGLPVISADIRKIAHRLYPDAVPWMPYDMTQQHAAFAVLWLQYDHVIPHSHKGTSGPENVVITCALCNFGKHGYTLRQLGVSDPRERPPSPIAWDGLERLRAHRPDGMRF